MAYIRAERAQPFESRIGEDEVVLLRFRYDPEVISDIKAFLGEHRSEYPKGKAQYPGGWLPDERAWFVEEELWPLAHDVLLGLGHAVEFD